MTARLWSTTPGSNNGAVPAGAPEGMAPGGVNNVIRQVMADARDTFEQLPYFDYGHTATRVDNDTFTVPTDLTALYVVGRRLKLVGATTGYATISASAFGAVTTVDVTMDSGNVPTSLATVSLGPDTTTGAIVPYFRITPAETAASVTPTNYAIPSHDAVGDVYIERYFAAGLDTSIQSNAATVTTAIANALLVAVQAGAEVRPRSKTYIYAPATSTTQEGAALLTAFVMQSNMHINAQRGCVFKMKDSQSTDAAVARLACFHTNSTLSKVSIQNIDFDGNGANNSISPLRPGTYNVSNNQAAISVSGTPAGVGAKIDDMLVNGCTFRNNAGVCSIVAGQSNTASVVLGKRWTITNNLFINNGIDTSDHTAVFGWSDDISCMNNRFIQDTHYATVGKTGGVTAYEIHGSNHRFIGNEVKNYYRGLWVGSNLTATVENSIISNNLFEVDFYGVGIFRESASLTAIRGVKCNGNTIKFDSSTYTGAPTDKSAISISSLYAASDIEFTNNTLLSTDTVVGSFLASVSPGTVAANTYDKIVIKDNKAFGCYVGVLVRANATNGLGYIEIKDNEFFDLTNASASIPVGVFVDGSSVGITTLVIDGNSVIDTRGGSAQCDYGMLLQGTIATYVLGINTFSGMVTSDYDDSSATITNRRGINGYSTVASTANLVVPQGVSNVIISGNTNIGNIAAAGHAGKTVGFKFTGTPTVIDGSNLLLAGNFVATADDSLVLWCDGTNWVERSRSTN